MSGTEAQVHSHSPKKSSVAANLPDIEGKLSVSNNPPDIEGSLIKQVRVRFKNPFDSMKILKDMNVIAKTPSIPKLIVVGDACVAKNRVLGALVGLRLPSGLGIPLCLKFEVGSDCCSRKLYILNDELVKKEVSENDLDSQITEAAKLIQQNKSNSSLTMIVMQQDVPEFNVILLPDIQAHSDPDKQNREMKVADGYISKYKGGLECMFLNVISEANFNSSLSSKVLCSYDATRSYTVMVMEFTRPSSSSLYIVDLLTSNKVDNPFGILFVKDDRKKHKIDEKEGDIFSIVDDECVGFDAVAKNVSIGMLAIMFEPSCHVLNCIDIDKKRTTIEIKQLKQKFHSLKEGTPKLVSIVTSASNSLIKLFPDYDFGEYELNKGMHAATFMANRLQRLKSNLHDLKVDKKSLFLDFEVNLMNARDWRCPSNLISPSITGPLLKKQLSDADETINAFVKDMFCYIRWVLKKVLLDHAKYYHELHPSLENFARIAVDNMRKDFVEKVDELIELEKENFCTCHPEFVCRLDDLKKFRIKPSDIEQKVINIEGLGCIAVGHLHLYPRDKYETTFDMRMITVAYWEVLVNMFVDYFALHLHSSIKKMIPAVIELLSKCLKDEIKLPDTEPKLVINRANLELRKLVLDKIKTDIEKLHQDFHFLLQYRVRKSFE